MIELTEEQRKSLSNPVTEVIDPMTRETYFLVRKFMYDRLRGLLDDDVRASAELLDRLMAEDDALDPYLESYQSITREEKR